MKMNIFSAALLASMVPGVAMALPTEPADSTVTEQSSSKEVKNRNVMLNASSADQPRQISVGLPSSLSATIFTDGLPESYNMWPDMPYFSWFGGTSMASVSVTSLSEAALQYGAVNYMVNSFNKRSTPTFQGTANYTFNSYGRQQLGLTIGGPIAKGWGWTASTYQVWDPGTSSLQAANLQNRTQQYKVSIDKTWANGRGHVSLLYNYARYTSTGSCYAPFIFVGDGSVKKYNGFDFGTDAYYGNEASWFSYMDIKTGKIKKISWKDAGTTTNHQWTLHLDYTWKNGTRLDVASKAKLGDVSMAMSSVSGITDNPGNYYLADGSLFTGDKVQNRWMMYVPGYERSWLTTATLTGHSENKAHNWRIGMNAWYNRAEVTQMNSVMMHTVENDPSELYVKNEDGTLCDAASYNPGSGEWYDGHENKYAIFLSDDWNISRKLFMSAGVRLEYLGYSGRAYLNSNDEDQSNTRKPGWNATMEGVHETRFTGDYINPAFTYNIRWTALKGAGLMGEYVYVRQRPNLQDYAGAYLPITAPVNINMARAGIFWNTPWMQLVSQVSFISQTNYKSRTTFYNDISATEEESVTIPITNNVQTIGWTTDVVLTPFKGFMFHGLLTLQNPVYKNFNINAKFPSGAVQNVNLNNNQVTAMSKVLIELDPSYSWDKWRVFLNFRYFSKQYINKTNTLYFNGWWETFGGISYNLNKKINFTLNVVNLFNQSGATGSISAADLVTDTSNYKNYLMSGSYIRPFELNLSTTINF